MRPWRKVASQRAWQAIDVIGMTRRGDTGLLAPLEPGTLHLPRLPLGVVLQLLLMIWSCFSARSARSRSSSMNCCSRTLALASRAAVSLRNWSIWTTSLAQGRQ